jgi:hypothetical protein
VKLLDFLDDPTLTELRLRMGARLVPKFTRLEIPELLSAIELSVLAEEGIALSDLDLVKVENDDTLSFKGYRVAIYIRDHGLVRDEQTLPAFHVAFCPTVAAMKDNKRLYRYAVTQQEDDHFVMNWIGDHTTQFSQRLTVCQRCLSILKWDGFDLIHMSKEEQFSILFSFALNAYYERYPKKL